MINYVKGDILEHVTEGLLVHSANAQGVMNSGFAKVLKKKYPGMYDQYVKDINECIVLGGVSGWFNEDNTLEIASIIGQEFYGREKPFVMYPMTH